MLVIVDDILCWCWQIPKIGFTPEKKFFFTRKEKVSTNTKTSNHCKLNLVYSSLRSESKIQNGEEKSFFFLKSWRTSIKQKNRKRNTTLSTGLCLKAR